MKLNQVLFFLIIVSLSTMHSCGRDETGYEVRYKDGYIQFDVLGPEVSEIDEKNPFITYQLNAVFTNGDKTLKVPGYFAADGDAAETGAELGSTWRVNFTPPSAGEWQFKLVFTEGEYSPQGKFESDGSNDEEYLGEILIKESLFEGPGFKEKGLLVKEGHYWKTSNTEEYVLKMGTNSPENFLAYQEFDGTYYAGDQEHRTGESAPNSGLHLYEPHIQDYREGDPLWHGKNGRGIIGLLNYLASKRMNSIYFLTMNIAGDGQDVFPYLTDDDFTRFDCSKLDQWDIVFEHAEKLGIILNLVTQETENELLLDDGDVSLYRTLYYRELIARFAHHNNIIWNLGEENGPAEFSPEGQSPDQVKAMASWFKENDPYKHPVLVHSHSWEEAKDATLAPLLGHPDLDGISMQVDRKETVNTSFIKWRQLSAAAGNPWILSMDEIGMYHSGALPDEFDPDHDTLRSEVLWGSLMAGASGVEWYFGYKFPNDDLNTEDLRSRDVLWEQTAHAKLFFEEHVPWWVMEPSNERLEGQGFALSIPGSTYLIFLKKGNNGTFDMNGHGGDYNALYFDPKSGEELFRSRQKIGDSFLINSPNGYTGDLVVLLKK